MKSVHRQRSASISKYIGSTNSLTPNVNTTVENNGRHVTAEGERKKKGTSQSERCEQIISFLVPGPVNEKGVKVARTNGTLVVTLPKA
jgi:HSP20 family molecular chaperone IbpA